MPSGTVVAACWLAQLPGGDAARSAELLGRHGDNLEYVERIEAGYAQYGADGNRDRVTEAGRLLDDLVAHAPEQYRDSMLTAVPLHREIMRARG